MFGPLLIAATAVGFIVPIAAIIMLGRRLMRRKGAGRRRARCGRPAQSASRM